LLPIEIEKLYTSIFRLSWNWFNYNHKKHISSQKCVFIFSFIFF